MNENKNNSFWKGLLCAWFLFGNKKDPNRKHGPIANFIFYFIVFIYVISIFKAVIMWIFGIK